MPGARGLAANTVYNLFPQNLHQHPLVPPPVELAVENLFPGSEIQFAFGDRDNNFAAHDLTFEMSIGVVFAGAVVLISVGGSVRCEFFQPDLVVVMKTWFVVINEYRGCNVHGVNEAKTFSYAATTNEFFDRGCDIHEASSSRHFEPKMFSE